MSTFNHKNGQYLQVNGANIYYEERGHPDKPFLLLLHGGFGDIEDLNSMLSYLTDDFRIIGIDSRGHGKSTLGNEPLTYAQIQSDVEAMLTQLKISRLSIIGFSDGGIVGYRMAASKKITVEKLITMGSSWCNQDVAEAEEILKTITSEGAKEIFSSNFERYQQINPEANFEIFTQSVVTMWLDRTETGHPDDQVKEIDAKVLLIRGENDFLVSLNSLVALKEHLKEASFMNVPFAEHVVYDDQPQVVESIVKQFLEVG